MLSDEQLHDLATDYFADQWAIDKAILLMQEVEAEARREPLTDAQIKELMEDGVFLGNCKKIVRAIERAHGITQKGGQHGTE